MTELKRIEYAQKYLKLLADGINPITNREVAPEDTIRDEHLSNCFQFVSEVLGKIVENGGLVVKEGSIPFSLSREQLQKYPLSDERISLSEFTRRVNALVENPAMASLKFTVLSDWLVSQHLLEEQLSSEGKKIRRPTEAGNRAGILTEMRQSARGEYLGVIYNRQAQQLLLSHMEEILASVHRPADQ